MKKDLRTMRILLSGKPVKQKAPPKKKRSLGERLLDRAVGQLLEVLKNRWNNKLWKPDF